MLDNINFKNQRAIELSNNKIKIIILPEIGGKIASIYHINKDFEFVFQNREDNYRHPELYNKFENFDAAGFDDAFPTIDCSEVEFQGEIIIYPDHGEIWTGSFQILSLEDNNVVLQYESKILPYVYTKTIRLSNNNEIKISYDIKNNGKEKLPCIFAAHYLVNYNRDMEICLPKGTRELLIVQDSNELGKVGTVYDYNDPKTKEKLCHFNWANTPNTQKYYINHKVEYGVCSIKYHNINLEYILKYDKNKLPYLGFWITEGGFRGDFNCALEPCTGFYDSIDIAKKNHRLNFIDTNSNLTFDISIIIKE